MVEISVEVRLRPLVHSPFGNKPLRNYTKKQTRRPSPENPARLRVTPRFFSSYTRRRVFSFKTRSVVYLLNARRKGGFLTVETGDEFETLKQRLNVSPHHKVRRSRLRLSELFFDNFVFDTLFSDGAVDSVDSQKPQFHVSHILLPCANCAGTF